MKNNINTKLTDNKFLSEEYKEELEKNTKEKYLKKPRALFWQQDDGDTPKETILKPVLLSLLKENLGDKLLTDNNIYIADNEYYLPPEKNAEEIIFLSKVYDRHFFDDTFDCDDFALMMKAHFVEAGYKQNKHRPPFCFGIAWGHLLSTSPREVHAINWMFVKEHDEIIFVEPQTGERYSPGETDDNISLILV